MNLNKKSRLLCSLLLAMGFITSGPSRAEHGHGDRGSSYRGGGPHHYHGGGGYHRGGGGYYNRGGYYNGGGLGGPNIIISVPPPLYYVPMCQTMEVCNPYGQCWLQEYCD